MEKQKVKYFDHFYRRLDYEGRQRLEDYIADIVNDEPTIRRHYSETYPKLDKEKFVHMILLDSIFIMELFLRKWDAKPDEMKDDYLFAKTWMKKAIERDLLLMENQIPFFLLDKLCNIISMERDGRRLTFLGLSYKYFKRYDPHSEVTIDNDNRNKLLKSGWKAPKHFTDLMRYFFVPHHLCYDGDDAPVIKTATKLKNAGITFEPISKGCLLDVKFKKIPIVYWLSWLFCCLRCVKARLQIPKLIVDGSTEYILRNLMAFEQCHYPSHHYVCSYVALLDYLIDSEEDVDVMVESEVIVHELGCDKDLAVLFNILCKNIVINYNCYASLSRKLDQHYNNSFNWALAQLRLEYFKDLWRCTGTIAGIIVLLFAVAAFIKNVKDLVKH